MERDKQVFSPLIERGTKGALATRSNMATHQRANVAEKCSAHEYQRATSAAMNRRLATDV